MTDGEDARRGVRRAALGAGLLAVLVFAPSIVNGFAYDDLTIIEQNTRLHDLAALPDLLTSPYWPVAEGRDLGVWRPLTSGALALLWAVGDGAPWPFHLANILVHGAVSAGVALLGGALLGVAGAWIAGLLFAVHPVHVEAVANAVGLGELLAGGWVVAAALALVGGAPRVRLGGRRSARVLAFFALGLLSKEGAAVLPALVLVLDAYRERLRLPDLSSYLRRRWPLYGGLVGVLALVFLVRLGLLGSVARTRPPLGAELLAEIPRIWTVAATWLEYGRLMVWPVRLLPDYSPDVIPVRFGWDATGMLGVAMALAVLALSWALQRRARTEDGPRARGLAAVPAGVLWFCVAVLPVSNVFFQGGVLVAERTLYLPSVGIVLAVAGPVGLVLASDRGRALRVPALAVVGLLATRSITYTPVWTNHTSVFAYLHEAAPEAGRGLWYQADRLMDAGEGAAARRLYRRAVPTLGTSGGFMGAAGAKLMVAGDLAWAGVFLERAWELEPGSANHARLAAIVRARRGEWPAGERWARRALENDEASLEMWHLLASALEGQGRWTEAATAREELLRRGERHAWQQWYWLARDRHEAGEGVAAAAALDSARVRVGDDAAGRERLDSLSLIIGRGGGPL